MKKKAYPRYKASGVEWLGEVPEGWEVWKLAHLTTRIGSGKTPSGGANVYQSDGVIFIRSQNVYDDGLKLDDVVYIDESIDEDMAWSRVQENDILLNITGASLGRTCIMPTGLGNANVNQHVCVIRLKNLKNAPYISHYLTSRQAKSFYDNVQTGSAREGLNFQQIGAFSVLLPPLPEQNAITTFLDRETGRIDTLIGKKQRIVELFKEKRTALISRSVTKGLDPKVKMKPSGVEWLGEVPEHWGVLPLKYICNVRDGTHDTPEYVNPDEIGYPLVTSKDLSSGKLTFEQTNDISQSDFDSINKRSGVKFGDILMPMIGTVGGAVLVDTNKQFAIKNIALFKYSTKFDNKWLCYHLNSQIIHNQFDLQKAGGVQGFVSLGTLRNLTIICPPLPEQKTIASFLDHQTAKLDALISKVDQAILKLKEYRMAIISAAVTGNIDIREAV
jgi:type I restriction enzyme S subunit